MAFVTAILILCTGSAFGQKVKHSEPTVGEPWTGTIGVTESVSDIMVRENQSPFVWYGKPKRSGPLENEWEHPEKKQDPNALHASQFPAPNLALKPLDDLIRPMSPQPIGTKINLIQLSESGFIPPDTSGDVGPTKILAITNGRIKSFTKAGAAGSLNASTDAFFNSVRNGSTVVDPMVKYDRTANRWFVSAFNSATPNRILLAVSANSDPDSSFTFFFFQHDTVGTTPNSDTGGFADYTKMGVDQNAVVIGANIFNAAGTSVLGTTGYVIRKSSVTGGGPIVVTAFRQLATPTGDGPWAPTGVDNPDAAATNSYIIGVSNAFFGRLSMYRVTNPGATPVLSALITITVNSTVFPQTVPALGSTTSVDVNDDRLFAARITKNRFTGVLTLWTAHSIEVDTTGTANASGNRDGARWYQIQNLDATPSALQIGTLFDTAASNPNYFIFPTIAMSAQGHMALGCTSAGGARRLEIWTAGRYDTSGGTIDAPSQIQSSSTNYTLLDTFGRNRWGDYSHTTVDPSDGMTIWTFQEYCNGLNSWMTQAAKLIAPPPAAITSLAPNTIAQGATTNIVVTGTSASSSGFFDPEASYPNHIAAAFSGTGLTVNSITFTDATHITLNVTASGSATTGLRNLTVTNPDGQQSTGNNVLTVTSGSNPVPTTTSISPSSKLVGDAQFTMTVNGTNFVSNSVVRNNGSDRTTTFVSSTQLTCTIPASDMTTAGTFNITVFNPAPGGGTSNAQTFTVNNPVPTTTSISPSSKVVGDAQFTMTVNGTNFVSTSVVRNNGSNRTTTFVSSTQLTCTIPASDMTTVGTFNITVFNPTPGGGTSNAQTFTVNNPIPTTTSISPTTKIKGSAQFTMTVNGTNFVPASVVRRNGADRTTTFVSSTQLTCTIPASDMTSTGTFNITVFNPTPGGGTSNAQTFTVVNPTITGTITLQNWTASPSLKNATIEIRNVGSGSNLISQVVSLNGSGGYSFQPNLSAGTYDMYAKADHWLKRKVGSVVVTNVSTTVNYSLVNGDCDNDNEVTLVDGGIIAATFGKALGDAGYDARADLDGDDEVTLVDWGIYSANFGDAGDD